MKSKGLLYGPFAADLPNFALVDIAGQPATVTDFTLPTEGYESPWAMARLVFEHDTRPTADPARQHRQALPPGLQPTRAASAIRSRRTIWA